MDEPRPPSLFPRAQGASLDMADPEGLAHPPLREGQGVHWLSPHATAARSAHANVMTGYLLKQVPAASWCPVPRWRK